MKKLVLKDGKYELADASVMDVVLGSYTNVITGVPSTRGQSIILGASAFAGGVLTSALVFSRDKKKYAWYNSLTENEKAV